MLECAGITKQSLVLDLNGRTGLLAFEAMRQTPEGGVWILVHDDRAYETLRGLVKDLPAVSRPQIIRTRLAHFNRDIRNAAGREVRFDAMLGRNLLFQTENMKSFIGKAGGLLAKRGVLVLAEPIPQEGQRLSDLAETKTLTADAKYLLTAAEEELFSDNDDPMIRWSARSLHDELSSIEGVACTMTVLADSAVRRITPQDVEFWFRERGESPRPSLGDRIRKKCDAATGAEIKARLHGCLDFKEIAWRSSTAIFRITFG